MATSVLSRKTGVIVGDDVKKVYNTSLRCFQGGLQLTDPLDSFSTMHTRRDLLYPLLFVKPHSASEDGTAYSLSEERYVLLHRRGFS